MKIIIMKEKKKRRKRKIVLNLERITHNYLIVKILFKKTVI
jgi:hypothetical protein